MDNVVFRAKSQDGYVFKIISELLQNIFKNICIEIYADRMSLRSVDSNNKILVDMEFNAESFNLYYLQQEFHDKPLYIGILPSQLYKMLKLMKKKDALELRIDRDDLQTLKLIIYPKENTRIIKSSIRTHIVQNVKIPLPVGYQGPVNIQSNEYQQAIKDMSNISNTLTIRMKSYSVMFNCHLDHMFYREVHFGEVDDQTVEYFYDDYDIEQFTRTLKITGLSKTIHMYAGNKNLPIKISSAISTIGHISIYLKSKAQIGA